MSLYEDLTEILTPYADKINQNTANLNDLRDDSRQTTKQFDSYAFDDMSDTYKTVITGVYMEVGETVNIHVTKTSNANVKVQESSDSPTALGTVGDYTYTASSAGYLRFYYTRIYCTLTFSDYRITNESGNSEYLLTTQKAVKDVDDKANSLKSEQTGIISRLEAVDGIRTVPFEMGTVDIIGNTMSKRDAANRMRSVSPVPLYSGDALTADEGYEFYLDKYVDNTWTDLVSWRTSYTVTDDGDYEIVVRLTDNSDITDTDEASESVNFSNNPNSALSAISANAHQIESLKDVAADLYDNILETIERTVDSSASGYEILSNGLSQKKSACKINKYLVTAGERLRITSDGYFQFQAQSNVSSVEPSSRLNDITYQPGVYTLTVPDNATYLALSTTVSDSKAEVISLASKIDNLEDAIESNAENIDELFEKIGYKQFVDFTDGYYIAGSVGGSVDIRTAAACSYSTTPLFAEVGQVVHCKTQGTGLACISVSETNNISDAICVVAGANNTGIVEATYEMQSDGYVWVSARTAVLEAWIETPKSTELITKVNSLTTKTDDLLSEVFDCNGTAIVRNKDFPSGNAYIELMRVNLKAGVAYTFSATIKKMQTANVYVYFYITNNSGENIGGGSLFGIKSNTETSNTVSVTKTFDTSYDNAVFRVRCSIEGTVESAEITYTKTDSVNAIPDYYYADNYLPNKVSRINTLALEAGSSGDVFVFITDMHWNSNAKHSPELIKYIVERSQIYRLFDGGDDENGGRPDLAKKLRECMGSGKAYFTMGNHEYIGAVGSELYYMYDGANNDQIGNPERHYYYVDDVQVKTRYIVMSAFRENGSGSNTVGYEADQITWLTTTALNVDSGWQIIIFSHCVYTSQRLGTEWILPTWAEPFVNAIDSYSGNGKIVCVFQGDHHADGINYTPNGIPVIATSCDKYQHWMVDGADMEPYLNDRIENTVWEQSFDVVIHNKTTKTIYCVRIGGFANLTGGNDALFEAGERVVTYT